jgi:hypothetical protein
MQFSIERGCKILVAIIKLYPKLRLNKFRATYTARAIIGRLRLIKNNKKYVR